MSSGSKAGRALSDGMIGLPMGNAIGAFVVDIDVGMDPKTGESFDAAGKLAFGQNPIIEHTRPRRARCVEGC